MTHPWSLLRNQKGILIIFSLPLFAREPSSLLMIAPLAGFDAALLSCVAYRLLYTLQMYTGIQDNLSMMRQIPCLLEGK